MKKIFLIIFVIFFAFGCTNIQKSSFSEIIDETLKNKTSLYNEYRQGYKYYLPRGLAIKNKKEFNEIISSNNGDIYLYMDFVSYNNKVKEVYTINKESFYSQEIKYKDNFGYLEINENNSKFFIEMMYNYAKIEIVTNREYLNEVIYKSIVLLSSINYNDVIIDKLMKDEILSYKEVPYNIFTPKEETNNIINIIDNYDGYSIIEDDVPDYDLVR